MGLIKTIMSIKLNGEWLNEKPFSHFCRNGVEFEADRCDFKNGVIVSLYEDETNLDDYTKKLISATAEMTAWHAMFIHPHLNGFQGYDCVNYIIKYK